MNRRPVLIAAFILALVAGGSVGALLASRSGDEARNAGTSERQEGRATTTAPAESESNDLPIRFVLSDRYAVGETIDVLIENVGPRAYMFESAYQACYLSYFDSSGRRFIIPPGTHCDLYAEQRIRPGERKKLFSWSLDECVKDRWGCVESRLLPPGVYTIKGRFMPATGGRPVRVKTTLRIVARPTAAV
jgi:hypothetical protein